MEQTYGFRKCTMFHLMLILNPQDLLQNGSLETVPICIGLQYYPHSNTVYILMCDECKRSNEISVCHRPWSILWSIVQVCSLIIEYRVVQYVPTTRISEQFESILLTSLLQISFLPLQSGGHQCKELILCRVVESFCSPTHNIVPHISLHDLPCHRNTKKYADFPSMVIFQLLLRKFWIQTWFCNCQQYLCFFHTVFEYTPGIHNLGKMLVLTKSTSLLSTFHIGLMFCFFPANFYVIHKHR